MKMKRIKFNRKVKAKLNFKQVKNKNQKWKVKTKMKKT